MPPRPSAVRFLTAALGASALAGPAMAEEGMWRPDQLPDLSGELSDLGLQIPADQLADLSQWPMSAVISLGNCTASFVSPQGLVVTNHHCAYGSIQYNSNAEFNYLADGFLAAALDDELPAAPGSRVYVTTEIRDVTDTVLEGIGEDTPPRERYQTVEDREKALIRECEADPGHRCQVSAFHGGAEYRLISRLEIRDVRLVYAPPESIGKFGGDIDNWMWPRHTGDWAFYRAYVAPDGSPADYAEDNVPFEPETWLKVSAAGLEEGDFVMAAGYPGSTSRYARLSEIEGQFGWSYPTAKRVYEGWADTINASVEGRSDAAIKYASLLASINNATKNYGGQLEGAEKVNLVGRRADREAALDAWITGDADRTAQYAEAVAQMDSEVKSAEAVRERNFWYSQVTRPALLAAAQDLYRLSVERQKPDAEREPGFQERDMTFFAEDMRRIDRRFDPQADLAVWLYFLDLYRDQPDAARTPAYDEALGLSPDQSDDELNQRLELFYSHTELDDAETRLAWMDAAPEDFEASDDPFIALAVALHDTEMEREEEAKTRAGRMMRLRPKYMAAITAWQAAEGAAVYPDANSTLRVTYGTVKPACPQDGLCYTAFTTLEGIAAKYTGEDPFDSPDRQLQLIEDGYYGDYELESVGSVPVDFLSTLDVTGGNSGSPTMDGQGNLVGLLFDGTYESINADWDFNEAINRSIHVDSRYMLWVMDYVDEADRLIEEMEIVRGD